MGNWRQPEGGEVSFSLNIGGWLNTSQHPFLPEIRNDSRKEESQQNIGIVDQERKKR